jgi:hypothetical protein
MSRREALTAREKILSVIHWATRAGYHNIAAELSDVLTLLPRETDDRRSREQIRRAFRPTVLKTERMAWPFPGFYS